jgi:hypothetical protein
MRTIRNRRIATVCAELRISARSITMYYSDHWILKDYISSTWAFFISSNKGSDKRVRSTFIKTQLITTSFATTIATRLVSLIRLRLVMIFAET